MKDNFIDINIVKQNPINIICSDPYFDDVNAQYYLNNQICYIDTSSCISNKLGYQNDPTIQTSFGIGEQIKHALRNGAKEIYIDINECCVNDAGVGLLSALGSSFLDSFDVPFVPVGGTLTQILDFDIQKAKNALREIKLIGICHEETPIIGENSTSLAHARKIGANDQISAILELNMDSYVSLVKNNLNIDLSTYKNSGVGGGIGSSIILLGGELIKQ